MKKCRCGLLIVEFLGLFCCCAIAESKVVHIPDATWVMRIEAGLAKRHLLLREGSEEGDFDIEMDYFKMGRYLNFFITVGVTSNKIGVAVHRDTCSNIGTIKDMDIVITNLSVNVPESILHDLREGLHKYRYHKHAGQNAGWVRISTTENGEDVVRWFDKPAWPHSEDREVLRTLVFARRTDNDEVWRRYLCVYRTISPAVNEFLKCLDLKSL